MYKPAELNTPENLYETAFDSRLPYGTRVNSFEGYPGVIPPLDLTVIAVPNDHGIRRQLRDLGITTIDPPEMLTNRVHQGRVFVNLSWVLWMADMMPGTDGDEFERQLFGQHISVDITRPEITPQQRRTVKLNTPRYYFKLLLSALTSKSRLKRYLKIRATMNLAQKSNSELEALIEPYQTLLMNGCNWNTRGTLAGLTMVGLLTRAVGSEKSNQVIHLMSDLGEVESAAPAKRIREIAVDCRQRTTKIAERLKETEDPWRLLQEIDPKAYAALIAVIDRYGYRSVAEFMIHVFSWSENPTPVMESFIGLLASSQKENTSKKKDLATKALQSVLKGHNIFRQLFIRMAIGAAKLGARTRERTKASNVIPVDMLRQLFREIERRMLADNKLDAEGDLYFLTLPEVCKGITGNDTINLRALSAQRRVEVERLEALPEPSELIYGAEPVILESPNEKDNMVLQGLGVSGSSIEGIARVVTNTDALDVFEPGEILVAPYTDAGWTPYFTFASAVIVETGGLMTHTSTVARELGLPAIVNVRDATTLIKTGDRLALNTDSGEVRIITRAEETSD